MFITSENVRAKCLNLHCDDVYKLINALEIINALEKGLNTVSLSR